VVERYYKPNHVIEWIACLMLGMKRVGEKGEKRRDEE